MSQRTEQIGSVIHAGVQSIITRGLHDPRVRGLVSVTGVEVLPDLSEARVDVSVLPASHASLTLQGLRHAAGHIQSQIAKQLVAKRMPKLVFRLDDSLKQQARIEAAMDIGAKGDSNDQDLPVGEMKT